MTPETLGSPRLRSNFAFCYALPASETEPLSHLSPWDGTAESHEDGYLLGITSLARLFQSVCDSLPVVEAETSESRLSQYLDDKAK